MNTKVFSKEWFKKHQKILVWVFNSFIGKQLFFNTEKKITEIYPNAIKVDNNNSTSTYQTYTYAKFSEDLYHVLFPLWVIFHLWDILIANTLAPVINLGFDTFTFNYADLDTNHALGVVGYADYEGASLDDVGFSFHELRTAEGNNSGNGVIAIALIAGTITNKYIAMTRGYSTYDTSFLTSDAEIISGSTNLLIFASGLAGLWPGVTDPLDKMYLVDYSPVDNTSSTPAYYNAVGYKLQSDDIYQYSGSDELFLFNLNSAGLATIDRTGFTRLGYRMKIDRDNLEPTWESGGLFEYVIVPLTLDIVVSNVSRTVITDNDEFGDLEMIKFGSSWLAVRAAERYDVSFGSNQDISVQASLDDDGGYTIKRSIIFFDTSILPDTALISRVRLSLSAFFPTKNPIIKVAKYIGSNIANPDNYDDIIYSSLSDETISTNGPRAPVSLNTAGIAALQKGAGAITGLALLIHRDLLNIIPVENVNAAISSGRASDPDARPQLEIIYLPAPPVNVFGNPYGYFLNGVLIKNPSNFKREFIYQKTDYTAINGKTTRDTSHKKEKFTLTLSNMNPSQILQLLEIINLNNAITFVVNSKGVINISTTCIPYIPSIPYERLGSNYLSDITLELIEED